MSSWATKLSDGKIKDLLTKQVANSAEALFTSIELDLIPAIQKGDESALDAANKKLEKQFYEHKTQIESLITLVTEKSNADQRLAESTAVSRGWMLVLVGIAMMGIVLAFAL